MSQFVFANLLLYITSLDALQRQVIEFSVLCLILDKIKLTSTLLLVLLMSPPLLCCWVKIPSLFRAGRLGRLRFEIKRVEEQAMVLLYFPLRITY